VVAQQPKRRQDEDRLVGVEERRQTKSQSVKAHHDSEAQD